MSKNKLYQPEYRRLLQTKDEVEAFGDLTLSYKLRKRETGERVYFTIRAKHAHRDNLAKTKHAYQTVTKLWPDARITSSSPNTVTINAGWNDPVSNTTPSIEHVVDYLQQYIDTYDQQPHYDQYTYKTVVLDIVYGLGVAIDPNKYSHPDGFRRWKQVLSNFLDDHSRGLNPNDDQLINAYDPSFGDNRMCECGHPYYRHFDSYEDMLPVGCKYCMCDQFKEQTKES